jgi:ABC-2 type transport system ATP-binding protein
MIIGVNIEECEMQHIIETRDLRKTFKVRAKGKTDSPPEIEAVRGLTLNVNKGEIFGFLGPNGAGKSTTLRMLATLLPPTSGTAIVAGHDLLKHPGEVRKRIGYVSQAGGTDDSLTGRENLILQGRLYGMNRTDAELRAGQMIGMLELTEAADRLVKTYSGGQRRRLDLAMGMAHQPGLLFLDEPTTALDPQSRARLWDEVRRLRAGGTTVFLTTHYLDEADALCDRLAIMDHGQIVAQGTPDALKRQIAGDVLTVGVTESNGALLKARDLLAAQPYVRQAQNNDDSVLRLVVDEGEAALPDVLRLLDGAGVGIRTVAMARPSLDEVFLNATGRSLRDSAN